MFNFRFGFSLLFVLVMGFEAVGQNNVDAKKVEAINNYVNFTNESTHGLLIVHRLLENFNKNINKYVDLPDKQMNFYSNKDLTKDIFDDPDNEYYDMSPNEWFDKIMKSKGSLPAFSENKLNAICSDMKSITGQVNQLRFDLEIKINTLDLKKRENLSIIYDLLEEGVKFYKSFYEKQLLLEKEIANVSISISFANPEFQKLKNLLDNVYLSSRNVLTAFYDKKEESVASLLVKHKFAAEEFAKSKPEDFKSKEFINPKVQMWWSNINRQAKAAIAVEQEFTETERVPDEYLLHDKYYYYYNISIINRFNRYGSGIVFEMNRIVEATNQPMVRYFEVPHYFKVVYPKLLIEDQFIKSSRPLIAEIPKTLKKRNVAFKGKKIFVDSINVEFEVVDKKVIDNDKISLSFNGDWMLNNFRISDKPVKFKIQLNKDGKNYLLLHTDDMGRNPPTTIGISYLLAGKKQILTMTSNMGESELIEIILQ